MIPAMMFRTLLLSTALLFCGTIAAQNLPPTVDITAVDLDQGAQTASITYTLTDPEEDACSVMLSASADGGATYLINTSSATGDLGPSVLPGTERTVIWNYGGIDPSGVIVHVVGLAHFFIGVIWVLHPHEIFFQCCDGCGNVGSCQKR